MKLDKHVVDMFTELTKPANDVKMEKTCYGTISVVDGTRYVKLDGSDLLVPAASTVKTSHGDRVTVLMKNHLLTITGNLTAPATDGEGGSSGEAGTAATIEVGTVTTGEAGSSAAVTNSGTTSAAVFDFVIPRGDKGEKGDTGPQGPQGEKGDTGTWDGTIPDHEHTISDITDFPDFALAENKFLDDFFSSKSGDIRALVIDLPSGGFGGNTDRLPNITGFPITGDILITWSKSVYSNGFRYGTLQIRSMTQSNLPVYQCGVYNDGTYTDWQKLCDGGNSDTVDGLHASDLFQKSEGLRSGILYYDIFSTTLNSDHPCWNKYCCVVGQPTNPDSSDYIDNAPETTGALWYEVFTGGLVNRAFQIAIGCFTHQRKTFIRYKHDEVWSEWHNIADGGNATTLEAHPASDFLYANGFAGQLAKLFSRPASDDELATLFSVVPDDATLDSLNPGIYVVNSSAARRSLKIPNETLGGGPNGSTVDNLQCVGGILIKLGSVLGKPGSYASVYGQAVDRPFTTSCAFFISNIGSIYRAIESISQGRTLKGETYMYTSWVWEAFVFDSFSNGNAYSIQSINYIDTDVTLAPGGIYIMYRTRQQFVLPYTSGIAYGPTKSFYLKQPSTSNPNLCIVNTSSTENLIIPAGRYLIHAK